MQKIKFLLFSMGLLPLTLFAQQTALMENNDESDLIDRVSILNASFPTTFSTAQKGIHGLAATNYLKDYSDKKISRIDNHNINRFMQSNAQWHHQENTVEDCRGIAKLFYKNTASFFEKKHEDYYFSINPVINYEQIIATDSNKRNSLNRRGLEFKGQIKDKIYFYTSLYETQENVPMFVYRYFQEMRQLPSANKWKNFKSATGFDYSLAQGYVSAPVIKKYMNATMGHGRHFIGDGYRSLFLSDFGTNYFYGKLNTHFWKFSYQNMVAELNPTFTNLSDTQLTKKYMVNHHLIFHASPKLEIGAFESVVFKRKDQFEFQYLNPVIFYRAIETALGSPDNAMLGMNFKALPSKKTMLYGQVLLDEFSFSHLIDRDGWFGNKYAFQLGAKYLNLFNVNNLDLQVEYNHIRPFTYSYRDSVRDYTHYNQPLAHPNGANLKEAIVILKSQPSQALRLQLTVINRWQGADSSALLSNGGNIFKDNRLIASLTGFQTGGGVSVRTLYSNLNASYELAPNCFAEAGLTYRNLNNEISGSQNVFLIQSGLRLNIAKRKYDF